MNTTEVECPECGHQFDVSEALHSQVVEGLQSQHKAEMQEAAKKAVAEERKKSSEQVKQLQGEVEKEREKAKKAEEAELALRQQQKDLEERASKLDLEVQRKVDEEVRAAKAKQDEARAAAVKKAVAETQEESSKEVRQLRGEVEKEREKANKAEEAELALRQQQKDLEERASKLDLEVQRKVAEETKKQAADIRQNMDQKHAIQMGERDRVIEGLRASLEAAQQKADSGSRQTQGKVTEEVIRIELQKTFPQDRIEPVRTGKRGADIQQDVMNERMNKCGTILWEIKNTQSWSPAWVDKLKQDQLETSASLAVIVSKSMPSDIQGVGQVEGVWVADFENWRFLSVALHEMLVQVDRVRNVSAITDKKVGQLYEYLTGDEFSQRVKSIVDAFVGLETQLSRERRAMGKIWGEREKMIRRAIEGTASMYGAIQSIANVPSIDGLELDDDDPKLE